VIFVINHHNLKPVKVLLDRHIPTFTLLLKLAKKHKDEVIYVGF